jgi:hypothetical protein
MMAETKLYAADSVVELIAEWKANYDLKDNVVLKECIEELEAAVKRPVSHQVKLSNGQYLNIHESAGKLTLASADGEGFDDMFICQIDADGVLVMPNSGCATAYLTEGLK